MYLQVTLCNMQQVPGLAKTKVFIYVPDLAKNLAKYKTLCETGPRIDQFQPQYSYSRFSTANCGTNLTTFQLKVGLVLKLECQMCYFGPDDLQISLMLSFAIAPTSGLNNSVSVWSG